MLLLQFHHGAQIGTNFHLKIKGEYLFVYSNFFPPLGQSTTKLYNVQLSLNTKMSFFPAL